MERYSNTKRTMVKVLSKSQVNCYLDCPYKWKKIYIDKIKSLPSPAQARGIRIHNKVENFYKQSNVHDKLDKVQDEELKHFVEFEKRRIKEMVKEGKIDQKYFYPIFQELRMSNEDIGLKGICDAIYINPKDDELIMIDWKTGKYYPNKFDSYRFELAVYAELFNHSGKSDQKVKYIGIYFTDQDKLFFEELKQETIDKMYQTVNQAREDMKKDIQEPKKNTWCWNCQFRRECGVFRR